MQACKYNARCCKNQVPEIMLEKSNWAWWHGTFFSLSFSCCRSQHVTNESLLYIIAGTACRERSRRALPASKPRCSSRTLCVGFLLCASLAMSMLYEDCFIGI